MAGLALGPGENPEVLGRLLLQDSCIGFNGERLDPITGLYHLGLGYRAYNPGVMRFHAADSLSPFGAGGVNSYAYCLGDPINLVDPTGHISWQAGGYCYGAVGGHWASQGPVLANNLGMNVMAYSGRYNTSMFQGAVFRPQSAAQAVHTARLNKMLGGVSKLGLYIRHPGWI
ncbi:RHS repeat-associated core domain-containing protein [Aeromonas hydrophila]|uniref:RHS repeat-associated core domain-containing protein n=1 Tax=Aeromonas hydrophila TaxID=644 RepID=UPI0038D02979